MNICMIAWVLQQASEILPVIKSLADWGLLWTATEGLRIRRVTGDLLRNQGRLSDGPWFIRRAFVVFTLLCIALAWWGVSSAFSTFHSFLWGMPAVILAVGLWSYMLADARGLVDILQERKMWTTGKGWADSIGRNWDEEL